MEEVEGVKPKKFALIVDDDSVSRRIMQRKFELKGFGVDIVESPELALALIRKKMAKFEMYSIILTDYSMSDSSEEKLNGAQLVVAIRMMGGHYATVPIVGITSESQEMQAELTRFFGRHPLAGQLKFFQKVDPKRFEVVNFPMENSHEELHSPTRARNE